MTDSRERILGRLRSETGGETLDRQPIQPEFVKRSETLDLFRQKLEAVHTSVDVVQDDDQLIDSVAAFLKANQGDARVALTPSMDELSLPETDRLEFYSSENYASCQTVMTRALHGIAETGTVVLASSPQRPTLANFLPDNCIVVIDEGDILPWLEDALAQVQTSEAGMPRALNLISGPSKTADIEQTLVYGAHGPIQLHVIVRGNGD